MTLAPRSPDMCAWAVSGLLTLGLGGLLWLRQASRKRPRSAGL